MLRLRREWCVAPGGKFDVGTRLCRTATSDCVRHSGTLVRGRQLASEI